MKSSVPTLSPRLAAVSDMLGSCRCLADIGTDHAYLPVYMCITGRSQTAVASDIRKGPLERAAKTVAQYSAESKVTLRLGGGLDTLAPDEADAVAIAGMGGLVIADILSSGTEKLKSASKIVVQPMTAAPELRQYLYYNGWHIVSENLVREGEKIYNLISVLPPDGTAVSPPSHTDIYIGRFSDENRPECFEEYTDKKRQKLCRMIEGLKKSESPNSREKIKECRMLLAELDKPEPKK